VTNIAVLLQTLDADGDPSNGIEVAEEVAALFVGEEVDFRKRWNVFEQDRTLRRALGQANEARLFSHHGAYDRHTWP
jgi:hypothetical protein